VSGDVLGALIARVSGQSLGTFMRERIFDPLGMKDTTPNRAEADYFSTIDEYFAFSRIMLNKGGHR
jgi:CubicO group peptidase (beta-lactamase class C family)